MGFRSVVLQCIIVLLYFVSASAVDMVSGWPYQWSGTSHDDAYRNFLEGCYQQYGRALCDENEAERLEMNRLQPAGQTNFTYAGYAKVPAPSAVVAVLEAAWKHRDDANNSSTTKRRLQTEPWAPGNVFVNHWEAPTQVLPLTKAERHAVQDQLEAVLSRWCGGKPLVPTSVFGIRVYRTGSILSPHIDRLPLVLSAIVHVAHDVDEDWPLELITHQGQVVHLSLQPGEMILYESHSILHGRPYPLQGRYYANVFVHFAPVGYMADVVGTTTKRRMNE